MVSIKRYFNCYFDAYAFDIETVSILIHFLDNVVLHVFISLEYVFISFIFKLFLNMEETYFVDIKQLLSN